ncbi:ribonuclease P protein component [Treponema pectinovorum]|uniref:ribonuclease P protein component n=1 Tax=Treponema pectinovorum TaxID=164 RepID=UPI0011C906AB|nr:ribonuclease P protein component [Treponema pectinovorum]
MEALLSHSKCFKLRERIKCASEIRNLFKNGKRVSVLGAKLFYLPNNKEFNRICFSLPHGFGNAVQRNRAKRFGRESFRNLKSHLNIGYDMIFLLYPLSENNSFLSRCEQFQILCKKAGLLKECENSL